jgi:regulator of protease activity HflC (stomatin/prohibitin superfamily)
MSSDPKSKLTDMLVSHRERPSQGRSFSGRPPRFLLIALVVIVPAILNASCSVNESGESSVKWGFFQGTHEDIKGEGIVWLVPYFQENLKYDYTTQSVKESIMNQSKDNLPVRIDVNIQWKIDPPRIPYIQKKWVGSAAHSDITSSGEEALETMIANERNRIVFTKLIRQFLRSRAGDLMNMYDAQDMNDNRESIRQQLKAGYTNPKTGQHVPGVIETLAAEGVVVEDVEVRQVYLPENIQESISKRAQSLIDQDTAKNRVEIARQDALAVKEKAIGEANAEVERAVGKGKAIEEQGRALRQFPEVLDLERVAAQKLAGENGGLIVVPDARGFNLLLNPAPKGGHPSEGQK